MAGHLPSFTSYAMTRALPSLSSSQRLKGSLEDSLNRVGKVVAITRKMRKHSYFQSTENRFTGSKMLRTLSIANLIMALVLDVTH
jgi:hypothetical protein